MRVKNATIENTSKMKRPARYSFLGMELMTMLVQTRAVAGAMTKTAMKMTIATKIQTDPPILLDFLFRYDPNRSVPIIYFSTRSFLKDHKTFSRKLY